MPKINTLIKDCVSDDFNLAIRSQNMICEAISSTLKASIMEKIQSISCSDPEEQPILNMCSYIDMQKKYFLDTRFNIIRRMLDVAIEYLAKNLERLNLSFITNVQVFPDCSVYSKDIVRFICIVTFY